MAHCPVTCINRIPRDDTHQGITHLGGIEWTWTLVQVVASIEARANTFYVEVGGRRSEVGVVDGPHGKYVRTHADGYYNDDLLALPECG
jgi:Protein of unknown function (DUF3892)